MYIIEETSNEFTIQTEGDTVLEVKRHARFASKEYSDFYINQKMVFRSSIHNLLVIFGPSVMQIESQNLTNRLSLVKNRKNFQLEYDGNIITKLSDRNADPFIEFYLNGEFYGSIYRSKDASMFPATRAFTAFLGPRTIDNIYMLIFFIMELEPPYS